MNFVVNIFKTIIAGVTAAVFAAFAVIFFLMRFWIVGGIFVALLAVYLVLAIRYSNVIHVDDERVYRVFPAGGPSLAWSEIRDVGVVGLTVLGKENRRYTGARFIYFSDRKLDDEELFDMCLKWPPEGIMYIRFSHKRIAYIQRFWADEVTMYNTGNLTF